MGAEDVSEIPKEYQRHAAMFDKTQATCFSLKHKEELMINFLLDALKEIDCKVYPLSREKQDQVWTFLAKEESKGYIY